jgi:ethanolamine utilization microcompartment shell protein EutS
VQFNIGGAWEIGGVSVALGFGASYPTGNVSIGVSLGFTIRYAGATVTVCVVSAAENPLQHSVVAFDRDTNWGRVYTAWVPD